MGAQQPQIYDFNSNSIQNARPGTAGLTRKLSSKTAKSSPNHSGIRSGRPKTTNKDPPTYTQATTASTNTRGGQTHSIGEESAKRLSKKSKSKPLSRPSSGNKKRTTTANTGLNNF